MKFKSAHIYLLILGIQCILVAIVFHPFFSHPRHILLSQWDDGVKNIFTLVSYVKEPVSKDGLLWYHSFCYPFGDHVFYTDNTPLFSIPFKWFCHHVADLSKYTTAIFQTWIISNIILCGLLIYYIFRRLLRNDLFAFIAAIVLPWTNVQVLRILRGHFNLSLSSFILLAICLLFLWDEHRENRKKSVAILGAMVLVALAAFLCHIYYLPIMVIFISASLFIYGVYKSKERFGKLSMLVAVVYPVVAVGISMGIVLGTDGYFAMRSVTANGYDWMEQKMRLSYLWTHYYFEHLYLPLPGLTDTGQIDRPGYLGNMGLFAMLCLALLAIVRRYRKGSGMVQKSFFNDPVRAALFIGSVVMLFISFGEVYYTAVPYDKGLKLINVLNPLYYLHFITNRVEQFRYLERFMWPFYYGFYIWVFYSLAALYELVNKGVQVAIVAGLVLLGGADVYAFGKEINRQLIMENNLDEAHTLKLVPGGLHASDYQAILPIPYYFTGAEDPAYDYNIDGDPDWVSETYSLSVATELPLMASNMCRTPRLFPELLMNAVASDKIDGKLLARLNNKPILVAVNKDILHKRDARNIPTNKLDNKLYWDIDQFVDRNKLQAFDSAGNIVFYKWQVTDSSQ